MQNLAIAIFAVSGSLAIICWILAGMKQSKRWVWTALAVAFAAVMGFSTCPAMSLWDPLLSAIVALIVAIGFLGAMWWTAYLAGHSIIK